MEDDENDAEGLFPRRTSEQRRQDLMNGLAELRLNPSSLARKLEKLGDDRPMRAILRSIDRMLAGETKVSPEMSVIMSMLLRQHRRLNERYSDLQWEATEHGTHRAQIDQWHVYLSPQTRGRWIYPVPRGLHGKTTVRLSDTGSIAWRRLSTRHWLRLRKE